VRRRSVSQKPGQLKNKKRRWCWGVSSSPGGEREKIVQKFGSTSGVAVKNGLNLPHKHLGKGRSSPPDLEAGILRRWIIPQRCHE